MVAQISDGKLALGGLFDGLKVNVDSYKEIIDNFKNIESFEDFINADGEANWEAIGKAIKTTDARAIGYFQTLKNGEGVIDNSSASIEGMSEYLKKTGQAFDFAAVKSALLNAALNVGIMVAFTAAVKIVQYVLDKVIITTEEYREKLSDLKSEASEIESDLSSMNDELDTTKDRLEELEGKGKLTFTEQNEYENLQKQNAELERSIALLELEQKTKNQEKNKAFVDTMNSDVKDNTEYTSYDDGDIFKGNSVVYSFSGYVYDPQTEQAYIEQQFEKRKQLLDEKTAAETIEEKDRIQGEIDEIDSYFVEKSQQWQSDADGIDYIPNPSNDDEQAVNEWLDFIEDFRDKMAIASADDNEAKTNAFNRIVDNWQFDNTVQDLQDLGQQGKVTADMLDDPKYDDFINKLVEIGVVDSADDLDDIALAFNNVATAAEEATDSMDTSSAFDTDSFFEQVNAIQSGYDKLLSAQEEFSTYGAITSSTLKDLMDNNLLQYMTTTADGISINTEALEANEQALKDAATAELYTAMCNDIQNLSIDDTSQLSSIAQSAIATLDETATTAGKNASIAAQGWYDYGASIESIPGVSDLVGDKKKQAEAIVNSYKNIAKQINSISVGKTNSSKKKSSSGSSSKSTKDELKEQFQAEYDLLKHNLDMNYITEEQYYNGVQALNEKYYAGKSEYLDEYRKYEEEVYKGLKSYYKSYCDSMVDYYEKALDANKISFGKYVTDVTALVKSMWDTGKISAEDYWNYVHDMLTKQIGIYDSVISAATQLLEDEIDKLNDEIDALEEKNDALNKEKDNYDSILSVVDEVYQKEIDKLNEQKEILQDKIDAINDANDALDLQYRKSEAIYALQKAQEQRNRKVYNGKEFVYTTDKDAIRDAQKTLQDIETEELIDNLEKEQKALDKEIEKLEEFKDKWSDVTEAYKKNINEQLAIARWGKDYEAIILSNRIEDINDFKNQYISIQKQVDDNQSTIDSINEKIDYYNKLKDKWGEVAKTYEEQQNRIHAAEVLGQDWEKQVLSGRLDTIQNFTNSYVDLCKKQAEAAQNAADAVVKANQQAQNSTPTTASTPAPSTSSSGGSSGGGGSATTTTAPVTNPTPYWTYRRKSSTGYSTEAQAKSNIGRFGGNGVAKSGSKWYVVQWLTGYATNTEASKATLQSKQNNKAHREEYGYYKRYFKGTDNADPGLATVSEDGDELVVKDDKAELIHGEQFYNFEGGERVIPADETKEILKNQGNVEPLDSEIITHDGIVLKPVHPEYENLLTNFMKANPDYMYSMPNPATDSYKDMLKGIENVNYDNRNVNNSVSIGEIHLHEVNDVDGFAKAIIRELPGKVNQALNRR